ncbi:MAG TPA: helix-turn-helix transcriptional regulator [Casimicrobiaceae bacterium]|jgi:XRE family aerobic/anaerobic benzoate catabolism transcriptional regulator
MSTDSPARSAGMALPGRAADLAYLTAIGDRVREIRARRGMSRRILARDSGVSERYLASLESGRGNISILLLKQIAQAMGVPVEQLARNGSEAPAEVALLTHWLSRLTAPEIRRASDMLRREFGAGVRERRRRIALIGLRGAGKTTLGAMLAARRRIPFVELDREIELAAGASLAELFLLYGQAAYRRHERRALEALLLRDEAMVIATGGSLVSEPETFDLLLSTCHVVWLKARPEEHMARVVAQGDQRPMAGSGEAMDDLKRILAGRDLLYRKADAIVDTSGKSIAQSLRLLEHAAGVAVGATRVG